MSLSFPLRVSRGGEKNKTNSFFIPPPPPPPRPSNQTHHRVKDHCGDRAALADARAVPAEEPEPRAAPQRPQSRGRRRRRGEEPRVRGAGVQGCLELELREAARVGCAAEGLVDREVGVREGDVAVLKF